MDNWISPLFHCTIFKSCMSPPVSLCRRVWQKSTERNVCGLIDCVTLLGILRTRSSTHQLDNTLWKHAHSVESVTKVVFTKSRQKPSHALTVRCQFSPGEGLYPSLLSHQTKFWVVRSLEPMQACTVQWCLWDWKTCTGRSLTFNICIFLSSDLAPLVVKFR